MGRASAFDAPFATHVTRYVYIPMRDGVRLACDLYRPASDGRFPCLMVRTPYNKNGFGRDEADRYVRRGYALCVVDARGTGGSEGEFTYYNIPVGLGDGADVVNWLAEQPFCDGAVGTFGGSALGAYQLLAAADRPPALKAMFVEVAPLQFYHDTWFVGGISESASKISWVEGMTGNIGPSAPLGKVDGDIDPDGALLRRKVALDRLKLRERRALAGKNPTPQDWYVRMRGHTEIDELWRDYDLRGVVQQCDVPTCYLGVWYDHFVRATCEAYQLHRGPKSLLLTPGEQGTHGAHADVDRPERRLRWFDHHLKGIHNGVMDEPPVKAFVMGDEEWRTFEKWPPGEGRSTLVLSEGGLLVEQAQARAFEDAFVHDPDDALASIESPLDIRVYEERALTYTSAPLETDLTVAGSPVARLVFRSSSADAHVMLKLADVFPDERSRQVSFGRLRAAHREGHDKAVPLPAGEAVTLTIPFWPVANTFKAGHRVRLVVAGSDAPRCEIYPERSECALIGRHGEPSLLELPIV